MFRKTPILFLGLIMKNSKIIAPIKCTEDIRLVAKTKCDSVYISSCRFYDEKSHNQLFELIKEARLNDLAFFINFKKITIEENKFLKELFFAWESEYEGA